MFLAKDLDDLALPFLSLSLPTLQELPVPPSVGLSAGWLSSICRP